MPFDGTQISDTAKQLIAAKQTMLARGWCAEGPHDSGGRVCMVIAIEKSRGGQDDKYLELCQILAEANGIKPDKFGSYPCGVGQWNDRPGRTLNQVLAAWDKAIAAALETV